MHQEALAEAVKIAGSQDKLAQAIGKTQQLVSLMLNGAKIAAETAVAIEEATEGKVPRWKLRPDLFPPPATGKRARVS